VRWCGEGNKDASNCRHAWLEADHPITMKRQNLIIISPFLLTLGLSILFVLALIYGWFGAAGATNRYFCEYAQSGLIREPSNTLSNLGFVAVGLIAACLLWNGYFRKNKNPLTQNPSFAILFSSLPILLGFGSMAMHASETEIGGQLDLLSMYFVGGFVLAYTMRTYFDWSWWRFAAIFLAAVLFCEAVGLYRQTLPIIDYAGDAAFGGLIALSVFFETCNGVMRVTRRENKWAIYALGSFLAAFAVWNFGKNDCPFCRPDSWLQAHALWHLLFALSLFFIFRLYVSENPRRRAG
jgi:ceramidase